MARLRAETGHWRPDGDRFTLDTEDGAISVVPYPFSLRVTAGDVPLVETAHGTAYPAAALSMRHGIDWRSPDSSPAVQRRDHVLHLTWDTGIEITLTSNDEGDLDFHLRAPGANAVAFTLVSQDDEHYYALGERFNKLDQRGEVVDLWVKNGASGGDTYKPVPFMVSSRGYGLVLATSYRVHCLLAHPTFPWLASVTVPTADLQGTIIIGTMARILERYTARIGRPPIPPDWAFQPWKAGDWRRETEQTALEDIGKQQEFGLSCGVKLIDAGWETEGHSFLFNPLKYPDPERLLRTAREAGLQVVLWISPGMTEGDGIYRDVAERGFLVRDRTGQPYVHRLGNEPGWVGTLIDFTHPSAVAWWQEKLRALLEMGVRGFKTDFGEQVPEDAVFADGRTGAELHNLYPVLYNQITWEVVREYDGILLARSAWAGSQRFPAIWAGDQSADFSPWAGLPTAIVAGQSAGWSGFPYWGCDIGGYFGTPDDECFVRWLEFAALAPIMQVHGLGIREPWLFQPTTLEVYRRYAALHTCLTPYHLALAGEATRTGLPLMRAMALAFPDDPNVHEDWIQYQYLYGPDLLVAPVCSSSLSRDVYFPAGTWLDFFDGTRYTGPIRTRVAAPLDTLPLFVRAGVILPLLRDPRTPAQDTLILLAYPHAGAFFERVLADGTHIVFSSANEDRSTLRVTGPERSYTLRAPFSHSLRASLAGRDLIPRDGSVSWTGNAELTLMVNP